MKKVVMIMIATVLVLACVACGVYFTRFQTMSTIEKITAYDGEYNLYRMDVKYDYDLDKMLASGVSDNQSFIDAVLKEALPYLPIHMEAPNFGCSAFSVVDTAGDALMGRNYDFKNNTSAMLVYTSPKDGYKSVGFAALTNLSANDADGGIKSKLASLASPFVCLDGLNEKGVSIAVLTLDSEPTFQKTGKAVLPTTLAIRLVLDRAATTAEAVGIVAYAHKTILRHGLTAMPPPLPKEACRLRAGAASALRSHDPHPALRATFPLGKATSFVSVCGRSTFPHGEGFCYRFQKASLWGKLSL